METFSALLATIYKWIPLTKAIDAANAPVLDPTLPAKSNGRFFIFYLKAF